MPRKRKPLEWYEAIDKEVDRHIHYDGSKEQSDEKIAAEINSRLVPPEYEPFGRMLDQGDIQEARKRIKYSNVERFDAHPKGKDRRMPKRREPQ